MADLATLQTQLLEAQLALHKLAIGSKAEEVQHGDMRTRYVKADMGALEDYIASLKSQISAAGGPVDGLRRRGIVVDLPGTY
jgi:hypothetical protein